MLSVIMPTINLDDKCLSTINSILFQRDILLELVVVIDGGKQSVNVEDNRVKIIQLDKNIGHVGAMNVGYKNTKFDFVTIHDNDDYSMPNRFKILFENIGDLKAISSYLIVNHEKENKKILKKFYTDYIVRGKIVKPPAHHCCTILHKEVYNILGEFNQSRYMVTDSERMIKLGIYFMLSGHPLKMIEEPLYVWNRGDDNYSIIKEKEFRKQCGSRNVISEKWDKIKNMSPQEFLKWWDVHFKK